ncbi:hypothetical protein SRHO_G00144880 [Serrasalmus rhombeus]
MRRTRMSGAVPGMLGTPKEHQRLRAAQEKVIDKINRDQVVFGSCEKQGKSERETVTPEQDESRAGPSHLRDLQSSTITFRDEKCATGTEKRTKVPEEVAIWMEDPSTATKENTTHPPTSSKLQHLYF